MATTLREAKPAIARRSWQLFHLVTAFVLAMTFTASISPPAIDPEWTTPAEAFDASLAPLDSIDKVVAASRAKVRKPDELEAVYQLEQLLRYRFYHGYSRYGIHENWLAWLSAKVLNPDFNAIVDPDEIVRHGSAACSQQAIVVQAALARLGVTYATVEVPEHFMTAAWIGGQWYMVDPWGPNPRNRTRLFRLEELMTVDGRKRLFPEAQSSAKWDRLRFAVPKLVKVDQFPAARALAFHRVTGWISHWLWLPLLSLVLARLALRRPPIWRGLFRRGRQSTPLPAQA
ncbi:hypothetical protein OKA06_06750 [Novosphingobium sp. MW5]|nr:hypothetical protein [Novosphingobium sp. MW5]